MSKDTKTIDEVKTPTPGTAVMTWKEKMAMVTAQAAATEAPKGGWLSFKGGNIVYDDSNIPGNTMDVVVVDFALENAYYEDKYNPAKTVPPTCYAIGRDEESMRPHPDCESPQSPQCGIPGTDNCCPMNEWASDPEGGRGKACKNSRRIIIMPADAIKKGTEAITKAGTLVCKIPSTSLKNFSKYVNQCVKVLEVPPFGVTTRLSTKPHPTNLFEVNWMVLDKVMGDDNMEALYNKHMSAERTLFAPYPKKEEEQAAKAPASKKF